MADIKKLVEKDEIIKEGFKYRRRYFNLLGFGLLVFVLIFALTPITLIRLIPILVFVAAAYYYVKFKRWEKANRDHIAALGFDVR